MTFKQAIKPRTFRFFFQPSVWDPTHQIPVVEIGRQQILFSTRRARLAMLLVRMLMPKRDDHAKPIQFAQLMNERLDYMRKLCAMTVNQGGPHILSVANGTNAQEPFFVVTVPVDQLGQEYGEAMLRLAYEALRARFDC